MARAQVAGRMECSLHTLETRLLQHITEEHNRLDADTALIATLCDAVRCVREYGEAMQMRADATEERL